MWVAFPSKGRKIPNFSYLPPPPVSGKGKNMEVYRAIHGGDLKLIQRSKKFIVSVEV